MFNLFNLFNSGPAPGIEQIKQLKQPQQLKQLNTSINLDNFFGNMPKTILSTAQPVSRDEITKGTGSSCMQSHHPRAGTPRFAAVR